MQAPETDQVQVHRGALPDDVADLAHRLVRDATAADGVAPLSEGAVTAIDSPDGSPVVHVWSAAAYAVIVPGRDGEPAMIEAVVDPAHRRKGHGRQLLDAAFGAAPVPESGAGVRVWAHGDLPGSAELLAPYGFTRARVLLQMRRELAGVEADPTPDLPDDVSVLPFRPGRDEEAWLRVNARAFDWHPEQGRMTAADLALREGEPWFDPAGFLMAWRGDPDRGGTLLGSHWTKVHPAGDAGPDPVGEVYVLGIDPDAQGLRLGGALTDLGLAHLRRQGLGSVLLYVEADNEAAVRLYERRGFTRFAVDVSWRRGEA